jgi:hypothetical protein
MPKFPKAQPRPDTTPTWLKAARTYYGGAFETNKKEDLAESMADWCEMDPDERGFVLAHLQYLNLLAQRGTQRLLAELKAMLEEIGDELIEVVEAAADELGEEGEEVEVDEDDEQVEDGEDEIEPPPSPRVSLVPVDEVPSDDDDADDGDGDLDEDSLPAEPA